MSILSKRLKELREAANESQSELAKILKLSKSSINMYERGAREPGNKTIEAIADHYNVDIDYLFGKSDIKNKYESAHANSKFILFGDSAHHTPPSAETLSMMEMMENHPDIRYLAAASEKATPEQVQAVAKMFDELYGRSGD